MLARQRQGHILERVRADGAVRVSDLARALGVSDMTVRRDLELLADRGLIEKVHGGATAVAGSSLFKPGFRAKSKLQLAEKEAIATAAAALVEPGTAIGVSAGTTTHELARHLIDVPRLTVVTNSVPVAQVLHEHGRADQTIILTGGVRTPSDALVGPFALATLRTIHVDLVFMGVHGMEPQSGFTTPNVLEAETDRALLEAGRRLVIVTDHTKWGMIGISSFARLDQADTVITDSGIARDAREVLEARVRELVVVEPRRVRDLSRGSAASSGPPDAGGEQAAPRTMAGGRR
jgi:DeoR/GlpR family transcriptional regulator of sugar metabolism